MFKKISRILPYLVVVPADPNPPLIGIKYFNLDTFMGQTLGWLKWPTLFGLLFSAVVFIVATFYIIRYTWGYFEKRKISKSWRFIVYGLFITVIAEMGELFCFYEWPMPGLIEQNLLLVIPHALGGALIGFGAYFLYKEIT
ncbi:hypothetical protein COY23_04245 [bacterium (Candidatus Torokbacteria) CG_4_10_14_0_2_um_filter_35_8]|nr:MAG: hypothetical protein COY23_04245 [bacterium (Candidatus Torokbacteria) CG_4_10_14_0_2_um_filter_35_8]